MDLLLTDPPSLGTQKSPDLLRPVLSDGMECSAWLEEAFQRLEQGGIL